MVADARPLESCLQTMKQLNVFEGESVGSLRMQFHQDIDLCGQQVFWVLTLAPLFDLSVALLPELLEKASKLFLAEVLWLLWKLLFCYLKRVPVVISAVS